jgi:hypothetical protein
MVSASDVWFVVQGLVARIDAITNAHEDEVAAYEEAMSAGGRSDATLCARQATAAWQDAWLPEKVSCLRRSLDRRTDG